MSLAVILRPEAIVDLEVARDMLNAARDGLGQQFITRLREVLERIEAAPELHGLVWQDVRAARLKRFRYVVYFIVGKSRIDVLAVLHGARDTSAWQSRA